MRSGILVLVFLSTPTFTHAQLSWHARVAPIYLNESTSRGGWSVGALNWFGAQYARRGVELNVMGSAEPYTFSDCGYSQLLATDPNCASRARDISAAHPLLMRAAVSLTTTLNDFVLRGEAAVAGEPAFGPPVYMHRASAAYDPVAPFTHHLTNAHHSAYSVFTIDVGTSRIGFAASAFDSQDRHGSSKSIDPAMPDAFSARIRLALGETTRMTISSASLPAAAHSGHASTDDRASASIATFEHSTARAAVLVVAGYHSVGPGIRLALAEATITRKPFAMFGRIEASDVLRERIDIVIQPDGSHGHDVSFLRSAGGKMVAGATWTRGLMGLEASLGARGSLTLIPTHHLDLYDDRRVVPGLSLFLVLDARSPEAHRH